MSEKPKELEEHSAHIFEMGCMEQRVYLKNDADAVIEAKDAEIAEIKQRYNDMDIAHTVNIAKMNAKIEELESNERRLKRALWLLNAEVFKWKALYFWYGYTDKPKSKRYSDAESKCRAMAEKFGG